MAFCKGTNASTLPPPHTRVTRQSWRFVASAARAKHVHAATLTLIPQMAAPQSGWKEVRRRGVACVRRSIVRGHRCFCGRSQAGWPSSLRVVGQAAACTHATVAADSPPRTRVPDCALLVDGMGGIRGHACTRGAAWRHSDSDTAGMVPWAWPWPRIIKWSADAAPDAPLACAAADMPHTSRTAEHTRGVLLWGSTLAGVSRCSADGFR